MASAVEKILDAASLAASRETFDDMLNQLPGLLVEQQRYRDAKETEARRYNDEKAFRNQTYQDTLSRQDRQDDMTLLSLTNNMSPDMMDVYLGGVDLKSEFGRNTKDALVQSNKIRVNTIDSITSELNNLYNVDVSKMSYDEVMEMKQSIESKIYSDPYITKQYGGQLKQIDNVVTEKFNNDFIRTFIDENQTELKMTDNQIQSIKRAKNSIAAFNIIQSHIEKTDFSEEDFIKINNSYTNSYNARKNVSGVVEETDFDRNMKAILQRESEKLAEKRGVDIPFVVPENSYELPQEQLQSLSPGQKIMEDNGVRLNITYSNDGSRAYVTPLKENEVVDNKKDSDGFLGFRFKNVKSMPESQIRTQLNIINNPNILPSSSSYKRAYKILQQSGRLPENVRQPE